jgi:hypothetical protein
MRSTSWESAELKQQLKKKNRKFRSVDPGIINPMTVCDVKTGKFMETDNRNRYVEESGQRRYTKKTTKRYMDHLFSVKEALDQVPFVKTIHVPHLRAYITCLGSHWNTIWEYHGKQKILRKWHFHCKSQTRRAQDRLINQATKGCDATNSVFLFGNGGAQGQFIHLKYGGDKAACGETSKAACSEISCSVGG